MKNNYKDSFEQIKIAGGLAAETLDEVTSYVKPGVITDNLDKIHTSDITGKFCKERNSTDPDNLRGGMGDIFVKLSLC